MILLYGYVYNRSYFIENNFKYAINRYHEDFGLTPLVIIDAKRIKSIKDCLYFYVQSSNSIIRNTNYETSIKKSSDMLYHFDFLYEHVNNNDTINDNTKTIFNSFLANSMLLRLNTLKRKDKKNYLQELNKRNIVDMLLEDTIVRKIKKMLFKIVYANKNA